MTGVQRFYIFSLIVDVILNTSLPFFRKIPKLKRHFFLRFFLFFAIICVEKRGIGENEHIIYFVDSKAY